MTGGKLGPAEFCRRGHDLRERGAYYERKDGGRTCRVCRQTSIAAWRAANPEGIAVNGNHLSDERRAKIAASLKAHYADPVERHRASLAAKRAHAAKGGAAK